VVVSSGITSLPELDDDLIQGFFIHVDDHAANEDLLTLGDWALGIEPR
jgi:hypothetical protein